MLSNIFAFVNSEQIMVLRYNGHLRSLNPDDTPLAMLQDIRHVFLQLKSLMAKRDEDEETQSCLINGLSKRLRQSQEWGAGLGGNQHVWLKLGTATAIVATGMVSGFVTQIHSVEFVPLDHDKQQQRLVSLCCGSIAFGSSDASLLHTCRSEIIDRFACTFNHVKNTFILCIYCHLCSLLAYCFYTYLNRLLQI